MRLSSSSSLLGLNWGQVAKGAVLFLGAFKHVLSLLPEINPNQLLTGLRYFQTNSSSSSYFHQKTGSRSSLVCHEVKSLSKVNDHQFFPVEFTA